MSFPLASEIGRDKYGVFPLKGKVLAALPLFYWTRFDCMHIPLLVQLHEIFSGVYPKKSINCREIYHTWTVLVWFSRCHSVWQIGYTPKNCRCEYSHFLPHKFSAGWAFCLCKVCFTKALEVRWSGVYLIPPLLWWCSNLRSRKDQKHAGDF